MPHGSEELLNLERPNHAHEGLRGFIVAAPSSGSGKTTAASVIMQALVDHGLRVQPLKIGPDFIDPGYHEEVTGQPSINLDLWMMGEDAIRTTYRRYAANSDICVIESMGALFDGENGTDRGSAAHIARLLNLPVLLVVDVWGMTRTTAAVAQGMIDFDPRITICGLVLNRTGSNVHRSLISGSLPRHLTRLLIGEIRQDDRLQVPERHLGLVTVAEETGAERRAQARGDAAKRLDAPTLVKLARHSIAPSAPPPAPAATAERARLAVARDAAFCFYYEENLRALTNAGFDLVEFSPLSDHTLPVGVDAVYIGGGYPESFAPVLAANQRLAQELRIRHAQGLPIHAECGGLLYLSRTLTGFDDVQHQMAGLLPVDIAMDHSHLSIRYVTARTRHPTAIGPTGTTVRGQEFHQSRIVRSELEPNLFDVTTQDGELSREGYRVGSLTASYLHLYFAGHESVAPSFHAAAIRARR